MGSVSNYPAATGVTTGTDANSAADPASGNSASASTGANGLANESTFLQLLVAQLKNQNPAQPMDGTTFVTQLAQFSQLEQSLASRQDLDAIAAQITGAAAPTTGGASPNTGGA